jgi:hypothetical protein
VLCPIKDDDDGDEDEEEGGREGRTRDDDDDDDDDGTSALTLTIVWLMDAPLPRVVVVVVFTLLPTLSFGSASSLHSSLQYGILVLGDVPWAGFEQPMFAHCLKNDDGGGAKAGE